MTVYAEKSNTVRRVHSLYGSPPASEEAGVEFSEEGEAAGEGEMVVLQRMVVGYQTLLQVVDRECGYMTPVATHMWGGVVFG